MPSLKDFARITAKNLAEYHGSLMDQPDATRKSVGAAMEQAFEAIRRETLARIEERGGHYCPDWDQMWVTRSMPAWSGCTCLRKNAN